MTVQRQQTGEVTSTEEVYQSVEAEDGVTFSVGNMLVDGEPQIPIEVQQWQSRSNQLTTYTTVKWENPGTGELRCSCNCPGWAMKRNGKPRMCKHVKDMMGVKTCRDQKGEGQRITSRRQAEANVPGFNQGNVRALDFS